MLGLKEEQLFTPLEGKDEGLVLPGYRKRAGVQEMQPPRYQVKQTLEIVTLISWVSI
jgi:hypothetical protein